MYRLTLSDDTAFDALFCAERNGLLTLALRTDADFLSIVQQFSDPAKTALISFFYGQMHDEHRGYTSLILVNGTVPGQYTITLRQKGNAL